VKQGKRPGKRRAPERERKPERPRRARSRGPLILALLVGLVAIGAWLWWTRRPSAPAAPRDPLAGMDAAESYHTAEQLARAGHALASLPYYRHTLTVSQQAQIHADFSSALRNAAIEVRIVHGVSMPITRDAVERIALMREALSELTAAEVRTTNAHDGASVIEEIAKVHRTWGFPWLCFYEFRRAQKADPSAENIKLEADYYTSVLHRPDRKLPEDEPEP